MDGIQSREQYAISYQAKSASVAQLVEQLICNQQIVSSSLIGSLGENNDPFTIINNYFYSNCANNFCSVFFFGKKNR